MDDQSEDGSKLVGLTRHPVPATDDQLLWDIINDRSKALSFDRYSDFIERVLSEDANEPPQRTTGPARSVRQEQELEKAQTAGRQPDTQSSEKRLTENPESPLLTSVKNQGWDDESRHLTKRLQTYPVFNGDAYQLLKAATELYVYAEAGRLEDVVTTVRSSSAVSQKRIDEFRKQYLIDLGTEPHSPYVLPYLNRIRRRLAELPIKKGLEFGVQPSSYGILRSRLISPILLELIWNYWIEQGLLVQTINLVCLRFQNVRRGPGVDPLANLEIDPLRPLSNLLWGYLQDEINRLSVNRRAYEYAHGLGLQLVGKAIPEMHPADVRAQFLPAFHDLLRLAWTFFREDDDTTIVADAFPMLNALRELHFVVSEGAHNQFGDLPMRARIEMLMQQWILGRPEMRDFLRGRTMVPYPEAWMDRVDAMKALQGWNDASVINYADLATFGEEIILSVRYGDWSTTPDAARAANWARLWRSAIQRYTHALRIISGIDLSIGDVAEVRTQTERFVQGMTAGRGATPGGTFTFPPAPPGAQQLPARPGADRLLRQAQPAAVPGRVDGRPRR